MQPKRFDAIIISPHIDDAVFSCGGLMALYAQNKKRVLVVNIFSEHSSGDKDKATSTRFFKVADNRHDEDKKAQAVLNFEILNVDFKDAIFRKNKYRNARHLFSGRPDNDMVNVVRDKLSEIFETVIGDELYYPLGVGGHVDHMTCYHACLGQWRDLFRVRAAYEDMPYSYLNGLVKLRHGQLELGHVARLARELFSSSMMREYQSSPLHLFYFLRAESFFMYRWLHQHEDAQSLGQGMYIHEVDITGAFEQKLKAAWCYESQTPQFLKSFDEHRELSRQYAAHGAGGSAQHVERFWRET